MSISKTGQVERIELWAIVYEGLQRFLKTTARAGFKLPMTVSLRDADGDLLREFTVERDCKIVPGRTDDEDKLYVFPLVATAKDAGGRTAILRLDGTTVEEKVEFLN